MKGNKTIIDAIDGCATEINGAFYMSIMRNKLIPRRIKTLILNTRYGMSGIGRKLPQKKKTNESNKKVFHVDKDRFQYIDTDIAFDLSNATCSLDDKLTVTGNRCVAAGIDTKIVPSGKCNHPEKRFVKEEYLDGLPIPEHAWTHCIFCNKDSDCFFTGECNHRIELD